MSLDYSKKYKFNKLFKVIEKDNSFLYVDYQNANWLRTNKSGREFIALCQGDKSLEEVIKDISEKYTFAPELLKAQFGAFIKEATDKGVILDSDITEVVGNEAKIPDYPKSIWIHVTQKCNLKCPFCYSSSGEYSEYNLDLQKLLDFLNQVPIEERKEIVISGGEPFLYKDLVKLVNGINEMGYKNITIITNGTVGEEVYKDILPYITTLQISIDGTTKDIHEITRGTGNFERVENKFKIINKIGVEKLVISFTPTRHNIDDLPNLPNFAFQRNINYLHINRLTPVGRGSKNIESLVPNKESYADNVEELIKNVGKVNNTIYYIRESDEMFLESSEKRKYIQMSLAGDKSKEVILGVKKTTCGLGGTMSINYDGNVYCCANLMNEEFMLGNINNNTYEEVAEKNKEAAQKLCVDKLSEDCKSCDVKYFCGGGCRACALAASGNIYGQDEYCEFYKENITQTMWRYKNPVD